MKEHAHVWLGLGIRVGMQQRWLCWCGVFHWHTPHDLATACPLDHQIINATPSKLPLHRLA